VAFDSWSNWAMLGLISGVLIIIWVGNRSQSELNRLSGSTPPNKDENLDLAVNDVRQKQIGRSTGDVVKPVPTPSIPKSKTETVKDQTAGTEHINNDQNGFEFATKFL
jgi:hypothetical protein